MHAQPQPLEPSAMFDCSLRVTLGHQLIDAVQARDLRQLKCVADRVVAARTTVWKTARSDLAFPSLDHGYRDTGITAFHLAFKGWDAHRGTSDEDLFDAMAGLLVEMGANPFAEFGPAHDRRTVFQEVVGVPPRVAAWMAAQRFGELEELSETRTTRFRMPPWANRRVISAAT